MTNCVDSKSEMKTMLREPCEDYVKTRWSECVPLDRSLSTRSPNHVVLIDGVVERILSSFCQWRHIFPCTFVKFCMSMEKSWTKWSFAYFEDCVWRIVRTGHPRSTTGMHLDALCGTWEFRMNYECLFPWKLLYMEFKCWSSSVRCALCFPVGWRCSVCSCLWS